MGWERHRGTTNKTPRQRDEIRRTRFDPTKIPSAYGLGRLGDFLDRGVEAAFRAGGDVFVDHALGGRLVQFAACHFVSLLGGFQVVGFDGFANLFDARTHRAASRPVAKAADTVLTKTFVRAGSIWHVNWGRWWAPTKTGKRSTELFGRSRRFLRGGVV